MDGAGAANRISAHPGLTPLGAHSPALPCQPVSPRSQEPNPLQLRDLSQSKVKALPSATALLRAWPVRTDPVAWKATRDTDLLAQSWVVGEAP